MSAETISHDYKPRGIGLNRLHCFICGHLPLNAYQADLAAVVDERLVRTFNAGYEGATPIHVHPVLDMFEAAGLLASLVYRPGSSAQVKAGACGEHEPNLELLGKLTSGGRLERWMLDITIPSRRLP